MFCTIVAGKGCREHDAIARTYAVLRRRCDCGHLSVNGAYKIDGACELRTFHDRIWPGPKSFFDETPNRLIGSPCYQPAVLLKSLENIAEEILAHAIATIVAKSEVSAVRFIFTPVLSPS